jgi:hypothetical protein
MVVLFGSITWTARLRSSSGLTLLIVAGNQYVFFPWRLALARQYQRLLAACNSDVGERDDAANWIARTGDP